MPLRHAAPRYKQAREDLAQGEYDHLLGWHKPSHREGGKRQGGSSPTQEPNRGDPTLRQGLTEPDHPGHPVGRRHRRLLRAQAPQDRCHPLGWVPWR